MNKEPAALAGPHNTTEKSRLPFNGRRPTRSTTPKDLPGQLAHANASFLVVLGVMLMPVALVRVVDMAVLVTVVLVVVALVRLVDMARRLVFTHVQHLAPVFGHQPVFNSALESQVSATAQRH